MQAIRTTLLLAVCACGVIGPRMPATTLAAQLAPCDPTLDYGEANGIAVDHRGAIYTAAGLYPSAVAGSTPFVIQKRSPAGRLLATWSIGGPAQGAVMRHPYGIAVDRRGRVYVVNPGASDVESFAPDGRQLARWGSRGEAPGQFDQPAGVAVDRHGTVYVADRYNDRIQRFSPDGRLLGLWGHRHGGPNRPDRLSTPAGVAVDPRGYVYVAEEASDVKVLAPTGRIVRHWGSKGRDPGQFMHALGIALDPKGDIYVASKLDGRFQEFSPDGRVLAIWPVHPHGDATPPPLPSGIAVALRGAIYTLEGWCSIRVRKRTPRGQVVATWRLS